MGNEIKAHYKRWLVVLCIVGMFMILLTGCGNKKDDNELLKEKISAEISYLDGELVSMANSINGISYTRYKVVSTENKEKNGDTKDSQSGGSLSNESDKSGNEDSSSLEDGQEKESSSGSSKQSENNDKDEGKSFSMEQNNILGRKDELDWDELKKKIETIYSVITGLSSDLKQINIPDDDINNFLNTIDELTISIKNEEKGNTLNNIIACYEYLPKFLKGYDAGSREAKVTTIKYNILLCYKDISEENWSDFENDLDNLKLVFSNIQNEQENFKNKKNNIKLSGLIIEEMKNTIKNKDKDIFFIKYKSLMQEMNILNSD